MSTPLIWIFLPAIFSIISFLVRRWEKLVAIGGVIASLFLAGLAWFVPIGKLFSVGPWKVQIAGSLSILGRRLILQEADAPLLVFIFLGVAFWSGGAMVARAGRLFVPFGLASASLLTTALAVEPFLYAAIIIELTVLLSVSLMAATTKMVGKGVLRFLTYQILGMLFILFAGWAIPTGELVATDAALAMRASVLLGLGFFLMLGVFPFHTWVVMIMEETHPYVAVFVCFILSLSLTFFGVSFFERYAWLQAMPGIYTILRLVGAIMVGVGGFWAAFQRHLGRMLGFAVIFETGLSLLALGAGSLEAGIAVPLAVIFASVLPRGLGFGIWALAVSACLMDEGKSVRQGLDLESVKGLGRRKPFITGGLILAPLTLGGFPLLAGFPVRLSLWFILARQAPLATLIALLGSVGLVIGGLRTLAVLVIGEEETPWQLTERPAEAFLLGVGCAAMVMIGILPQWFIYPLISLSTTFLSGAR